MECSFKGLVHPKMKISLCFTPSQSILGIYDFLLSDESNWSYIKNCPGPSKPYNGVSGCFLSTVQKTWNKVCASVIKCAPHGTGGWIKASYSKSMCFCKINIHISNVINTVFSLPLTDGSRRRRCVISDKHGERTKQNAGQELEAQNEDL